MDCPNRYALKSTVKLSREVKDQCCLPVVFLFLCISLCLYVCPCCPGAPEAETGGEPEAEKGGGLAAEPEPGGPDLAAPARAGEMKSEDLQKKNKPRIVKYNL